MEIIYSDKDLIVINKPPGLAVHPPLIHKWEASGGPQARGKTLVDFLLEQFPEVKSVGDDPKVRPGIVHRLDKDTSGVMVVARNQRSFEALKNFFKTRRVEKVYWAIVCGVLKEKRGVVSLPIGRLVRNPLKRGWSTPGVDQAWSTPGVDHVDRRIRGVREAVTGYRVLKAGEKFSLIELNPKTGRMHQLRVHLKAIGHPVACDKLYGGKNVCCPHSCSTPGVAQACATPGVEHKPRQLLHAQSLSFSYPEGRKLHFETDPPEDFEIAISKIV